MGIVSINLGLNQEDILYSCSYAPNATLTVKASEVYELASNSNVESVYLESFSLVEIQNDTNVPTTYATTDASIEDCFEALGISYLRDVLRLTGTGIKIGMIETKRLKTTESVFSHLGDRLVVDSEITGNMRDHPSKVAAIMVGKQETNGVTDYIGAVPDATLYFTKTGSSGNPVDSSGNVWKERIEW